MPKFTVAIAGAGLGGLVFAIALQKYAPDVDFQIYEAAAQLAEIGAGIGFQPRTWFVMRELGLESALLNISGNGQKSDLTLIYRKADQHEGFTFNESVADKENYTFHRAQLHQVFLAHIQDPRRIHLGKRFASYTLPTDPAGQIDINFKDGSTTTCDVLVGADGIKSNVRASMYTQLADAAEGAGRADEAFSLRSCIAPVWSGFVTHRALLKREPDDQKSSCHTTWMDHLIVYCGKKRHVVSYPIAKGRALNIAAVTAAPELEGTLYEGPWVAKVPKEEVTDLYSGWEPEVEEMIRITHHKCTTQAVDSSGWSKWAIHVVKKLPTFVDGRVVLLADAAHAMVPFQGAGAGQGFEDALMLGKILGHPKVTRETVSSALKVYDELRRPVAQHVAALCLRSGQFHSFIAPEIQSTVTSWAGSDGQALGKEQLAKLTEAIERVKEWRNGTTVEEDCKAALRKIDEQLA
ncbi:hypothetical protein BN946_scf185043.g232 [Trametes cinnabarina]|uniref:FAD-binding domain-containing protein n=1 Tax=Pycnoporus cinnabarinus TaxID=5643 RepID=A0A060SIE9_PYCCI|nr:hypothetical protein BN946_scf185043.g232 [Trametes cinnabarina]